jgi:hypothetical protein
MATDIAVISSPKPQTFKSEWEVFCRARVAGKTQREAWVEAYPERSKTVSYTTQGQNGSDMDRRPEVKARISELRSEAMADAKQTGAALLRDLAAEIVAAQVVEDAAAVTRHMDELEADAIAAGDAGLQVRGTICACRVKLVEVLGRIRLQAYGQIIKYASRAKFTSGDGSPVAVQINFGGSESVEVRGGGQAVQVQQPAAVEALLRVEGVPDAGE